MEVRSRISCKGRGNRKGKERKKGGRTEKEEERGEKEDSKGEGR